MNRDEFIEKHITGLLARHEKLTGMGIIATPPQLETFQARGQTNIEKRIERYIYSYHVRTGAWPRIGQIMRTTRQRSDELVDVVNKSPLFEMRNIADKTTAWRNSNSGMLANNVVVLLCLETES